MGYCEEIPPCQGGEAECPEKQGLPHPYKCPRPGWNNLGKWKLSLPAQPNPTHPGLWEALEQSQLDTSQYFPPLFPSQFPLTSDKLGALHHVGVRMVNSDLKPWKDREKGPSEPAAQPWIHVSCTPSLLQPCLEPGRNRGAHFSVSRSLKFSSYKPRRSLVLPDLPASERPQWKQNNY